MASYKDIKKEDVLKAINKSYGIVSTVASRIGCTWETARKLINRWTETKEAWKCENETILDVAESQVFKSIIEGDISSAKWVLARKGRERGYDETAILVNNREPLNINITGDMQSQEQLQNSSGVEIPRYDDSDPGEK